MTATETASSGRQQQLNIEIPSGLHRLLKVRAARTGTTMRGIVVELLQASVASKKVGLCGEEGGEE